MITLDRVAFEQTGLCDFTHQVTSAQLPKLARLAAGRLDPLEASTSSDNGAPNPDGVEKIAMDEFR